MNHFVFNALFKTDIAALVNFMMMILVLHEKKSLDVDCFMR